MAHSNSYLVRTAEPFGCARAFGAQEEHCLGDCVEVGQKAEALKNGDPKTGVRMLEDPRIEDQRLEDPRIGGLRIGIRRLGLVCFLHCVIGAFDL